MRLFQIASVPTLLACLLPLQGLLLAQSSEALRDRYVEAKLISENSHISAGTPFRLGLLLKHDSGWHTYWKRSATGYATSIQWDLPPGFTAGPIQWPTPITYDFQGWTEYVYEKEVVLGVVITPPDSIGQDSIKIGFSGEWLMCKDICVPGGVSSSITLPVKDIPPQKSADWADYFEQHDRELPAKPQTVSMNAWRNGPGVILEIMGDRLPGSAVFFDEQGLFEPASGKAERIGKTIRMDLAPAESADASPARLSGVLRAENGWPGESGKVGLIVDLPIVQSAANDGPAAITGLPGLLLLAFAGGLILNLMPCVFPVIGIKIMGFVSQAGESKGKVALHGLVFTAGVLVSFWILSAVLLILRSGGSQLGWGFQLQSPGFVLVLTLLLFAFGLNMSGLFEVGQSTMGVGSKLTAKSGFAGSFFSGVLATVVATPCAAPFLAPALGAALTLPPAASITVFTFIALGLSTPYLVLSSWPSLIKLLPRPGPWMETFKQVMSFLLYATVAYLLWVLAGQLTAEGGYSSFSFLKVLLSLVLLAMALWVFGRWGAFHLAKITRYKAVVAAALLGILSLVTGLSGTSAAAPGDLVVNWDKWEPGKAESLAEAGSTVYVDFTARWCVTCQTNKAAVFSSNAVLRRISDEEIILLKADWTHQDPKISEALARFNRSAVPFNLVYGPGKPKPVVLPEFLTPSVVMDAFDAVKGE